MSRAVLTLALLAATAHAGDRALVGAQYQVVGFDLADGSALGFSFAVAGPESVDVVETPRGTLLVSNAQTSTTSIEERDAFTGALITTFATGTMSTLNPMALTVAPEGDVFYVADQALGLQERDLDTGAVLRTFTPSIVNTTPGGAEIGPDGLLYVALRDSFAVWRYDRSTGQRVDIVFSGYPQRPIDIDFDADGNAYVSTALDGKVWRHAPNGAGGYLARVEVVDLPSSGYADGLGIGPDGRLYVLDRLNDVVVQVDPATGAVLDATWASAPGMNITERTDIAFLSDFDDDLLLDGSDNCPGVANPDQADADGDGFGDACAHPSAQIDPTVRHFGAYIAAKAVVGAGASLGPGAVVGRRAVIGAGTSLGADVAIARAAIVGEDATLGDDVAIGYAATVGDRAVLGSGVRLGNLATVGDDVVLGAGTVLGRSASVSGGAWIGAGVAIGPECRVVGGTAPQLTVEDDARLLRGAVIEAGGRVANAAVLGRDVSLCGGATVGRGAVVRAGNFVCSDVGEFVVVPRGAFPDPGLWVDPAYAYRQLIDLSAGPGAGTGYVVRLDVGVDASVPGVDLHLGGHALDFPAGEGDGGDLFFHAYGSATPLPFWVERVQSGKAVVWVRVSADLGSPQVIQLYYGRAGAPNLADGEATFDLFDTFDGAALDAGKWALNDPGDGVVVVSGGKVTMGIGGGQSGRFHGIHSLAEFPVGTQATWRGQINDESGSNTRDGFGKQSVGIAFWTAHSNPGVYTFVSDLSVPAQFVSAGLSEVAPHTRRWGIQRLPDGTGRYHIDEVQRSAPASGSYSTVAPLRWEVYSGYDIVEVAFVSKFVPVEPDFAGSRGEEAR